MNTSTADARIHALETFARTQLGDDQARFEVASADASFRSYWRVHSRGRSHVVMNAPPDKEDIGPWLDIAARLTSGGVHAPAVLAVDRSQGFILMDDLGDRLYLPALDASSVDRLYADAMTAILAMQTRVDTGGLPRYDRARLTQEMELLPTWFLQRHLGLAPGCEGWDLIEAAFTRLADSALEQPQAFVHRDFHSRNLLVLEVDSPGVIDFQDAVLGPITYDPVSLLRDCYIEWPDAAVDAWSQSCRRQWCAATATTIAPEQWRRWFDWMGLQRHLKVLGIFCRLNYRDGKAGYLRDLPLVLKYTLTVARRYAELRDFAEWLDLQTRNVVLTQPSPP